jgi:hypothetical protein
MQEADWQLYVDESGAFRAGDGVAPSFVGGVLVRDTLPGADEHQLRDAIAHASGGLPYPPHATQLRGPLGGLIALACQAGANHADVKEFTTVHAHVKAVVDSATAGRWPQKQAWRAAEAHLMELSPEKVVRIQKYGRGALNNMQHLLAAVAEFYGPEDAYFVAGFAPNDGSAPTRQRSGAVVDDAYTQALVCMMERCADILTSTNRGPARVWYSICERNIRRADVGRVGISANEISALLAASGEAEWGRGRGVRFVARNFSTRFDANAPGGVVLADFACNLSYGLAYRVQAKRSSLVEFSRKVREATRLSVACRTESASGDVRCSTLACDGPPRRAVAAARAGIDVTLREPRAATHQSWRDEQASEWVTYFDAEGRR